MLFESSYIIWISVAVGFVMGSIITRIFNARGIYLPGAAELAELYGYPDRMRPVLSVYSVSLGVGSVLLISFLTALYPVRKLRHLHPVEALVKR
jgi:ABC-type antimicrobial peptide transport system permease subunit